jgi:hypothetical protein
MTTTAADLKEQLKDLPHMQAMADNNLTEADLPGPIKMKMGPLKMQLVRFEKNQNPTKAQLDGLIALSVKVADAIQTWAEERSGAKPAAAASQTPPEPPTNPDDGKNAPPNLPGVVGAPASYPLREAVMAHIDKGGRIYHDDLKKILKKRSLADREEVEGVVLVRRVAFYYPS